MVAQALSGEFILQFDRSETTQVPDDIGPDIGERIRRALRRHALIPSSV